jgi:hypothetical protein
MEKATIDILLEDIIGDDGLADYPAELKYTLAVLFFVWQTTYGKELQLTTDINQWLAELELEPMNVEAAFKKLRDVGILNNQNRFRTSMKEFSFIEVMLFAHALYGTMEVSIRNGEYAFKMTEAGNKAVEAFIETPDGKEFWNELDKKHGGKHQR